MAPDPDCGAPLGDDTAGFVSSSVSITVASRHVNNRPSLARVSEFGPPAQSAAVPADLRAGQPVDDTKSLLGVSS